MGSADTGWKASLGKFEVSEICRRPEESFPELTEMFFQTLSIASVLNKQAWIIAG